MNQQLRDHLAGLCEKHDAALAAETKGQADGDAYAVAVARADQLRVEADLMAVRTTLLAELDQLEAAHSSKRDAEHDEWKLYKHDLRLLRRAVRAGRRGLGVKIVED